MNIGTILKPFSAFFSVAMSAEGTPYSALEEELQAGGFDVVAPMKVSWYNDYLKELGLATDSTSCMCDSVFVCVCVCVCVCVYACEYVYVCVYVCTYVCE